MAKIVCCKSSSNAPKCLPGSSLCTDRRITTFSDTGWYYFAFYAYHCIKWLIIAACGFLGFRFNNLFRIGSAAFAGAYELQSAGIAVANMMYGFYPEEYESKAQTQTVMSGVRLFWLYFFMAWGIWVQAGLMPLAKAADEAEMAGRARARLRANIEEIEEELKDPEVKQDQDQVKVLRLQLDSINVAAAVAEKKVCAQALE